MVVTITVSKLKATRNFLLEVYEEHRDVLSDRYATTVLDVRNLLTDLIDDLDEVKD